VSDLVDEVEALLRAVERELRGFGRLSFLTCEVLRSHEGLHGLEPCLRFLGCTVFAADPDEPPVSRRYRVQMCRLMLLSLAAHTTTPRWSCFQLEQMFEASLQIPGAELSDLVQAQFALLAETPGPTSTEHASFLRELGHQVAGKRRLGHADDDFVWIAVRLEDAMFPATEAQAYFATHALPRRLRSATREVILRTVVSPLLADEVARALDD